MLGRVAHPQFGNGVSMSESVSQGGKPASVVVFDLTPTTERTIYDSFLKPSKAPMPEVAKPVKPARKPRKKKTEDTSDELLVDMTPKVGIDLDQLPDIDELPEELKNEGDGTGDCTETV